MFDLPEALGRTPDAPLRLLCIGAHADDVEIGAGGTVRRLLDERPHADVTWVVASAGDERAAEARASAREILGDRADVRIEDFPDGRFPYVAGLKDYFGNALQPLRPHLVLTHRTDDGHQDHRTLGELAWQTFRGATIAAFEIPKWDADLDRPNAYVALSRETAEAKAASLMRHFPSQAARAWFDPETFLGLMRVRGVEAGVPFAEAFHCRKLVW